jgi:predicted XRE-type DNA-binding protein
LRKQQQIITARKGARTIRPNIDIELAIVRAGVKKYQIAEKLGINDGNFSRKLRKELSQPYKDKIFEIINTIKKEQKLG